MEVTVHLLTVKGGLLPGISLSADTEDEARLLGELYKAYEETDWPEDSRLDLGAMGPAGDEDYANVFMILLTPNGGR